MTRKPSDRKTLALNIIDNDPMIQFALDFFNDRTRPGRGRHGRLGLAALMFWLSSGVAAQTLSPALTPVAQASVNRIEPLVLNGQLMIDIDTELSLNPTMVQALERGLPLFFSIDVEIDQSRWWWFDRVLVDTTLTRRLSFNNLTQQWRVSTGDLSLTFSSFEESLMALRRVRNWSVALSDRFEPGTTYNGRARLRLDSTQLARPLQLDPANRNNWALSSPWKRFEFMIRRTELNPS